MKLLTLRTADGTKAVRQDGTTLTEIDGFSEGARFYGAGSR